MERELLWILIVLVCFNVGVSAFLFYQLSNLRKATQGVKAIYFGEVSEVSSLIKKQKKVLLKCQLLMGEIPVGQPFIVSEQLTETIDKERIDSIIENLAKPIGGIGIKIISKGLL